MKTVKQLFYISCCIASLISCNSNSLKQADAENTIRNYLSQNTIQTQVGTISPQTIQKTGKTNIYTQFNTSVKVYFNENNARQQYVLLFIFTRTTGNKWFLTSVEAIDDPPQELTEWLIARKKIKIPV